MLTLDEKKKKIRIRKKDVYVTVMRTVWYFLRFYSTGNIVVYEKWYNM